MRAAAGPAHPQLTPCYRAWPTPASVLLWPLHSNSNSSTGGSYASMLMTAAAMPLAAVPPAYSRSSVLVFGLPQLILAAISTCQVNALCWLHAAKKGCMQLKLHCGLCHKLVRIPLLCWWHQQVPQPTQGIFPDINVQLHLGHLNTHPHNSLGTFAAARLQSKQQPGNRSRADFASCHVSVQCLPILRMLAEANHTKALYSMSYKHQLHSPSC